MTKQEAIEAKIREAAESYSKVHMESKGFYDGANWYKENESKPQIDINKLRDEFFAECTITETIIGQRDVYTNRSIKYAPHDLFEWFKKKLTTKL